ncbi:MAG: DinB family protein [Caldilineaceae bacterium]|nr:DinB family protein [Caldilineaceae bacterium]
MTIDQARFRETLSYLLDETFEQVRGIYLDKGTSLFETLATISAEEASIPVGGKCGTLAAQVEHVRFYLDVFEKYMLGEQVGELDWDEIWRSVQGVSAEQWEESQVALRSTYERVRATMLSIDDWDGQYALGGAIGIIAHTAYHLGEIRQALCTLRD